MIQSEKIQVCETCNPGPSPGKGTKGESMKMPSGLGSIIALIVLVLVVVFVAIGQMPLREGALIGGLAVARLT